MIWYYFDGDGTRDAIEYNGTVYYYMYNPQGDVIGLLDDNLNVVVEYKYDSWGNVLSITGSLASTLGQDNPFRYRGYYYDNETGLYYLNSRYYHPQIGRFINADSYVQTGQGLLDKNMFAYCLNNPVNRVDEDGDSSVFLIALGFIGLVTVIGGIIGLCSDEDLYSNFTQNQNENKDGLPTNNITNTDVDDISNSSKKQTEQQKPQLTTKQRARNAAIGASLGLFTAGAAVLTVGAVIVLIPSTMAVTAVGIEIAAAGVLAFDIFAMGVAPFFGIEMEPIEWTNS